MYVENMHLH